MAVPAKAVCQLRLSRSLGKQNERKVDRLPRAALCSWGGAQDQRPLLFISDIVPTNGIDEEMRNEEVSRGAIDNAPNASASRYYSPFLCTDRKTVGLGQSVRV